MTEEITHELIKRSMDIIKGNITGDKEYAANCLNAVGVILANKYLDECDRTETWRKRSFKWADANQKLSDLNQRLQIIIDEMKKTETAMIKKYVEDEATIKAQRDALENIEKETLFDGTAGTRNIIEASRRCVMNCRRISREALKEQKR